jgi:sec-independent protein translocase protein TatA
VFSDAFAPWHIVIILVILVLLFGSTKLPGAARSVGRSMRIFKAEMKGLSGDEEDSQQAQQQQQPPQAFAPPAQVMPPTPNVQDVPQGQQQSQEHSSI